MCMCSWYETRELVWKETKNKLNSSRKDLNIQGEVHTPKRKISLGLFHPPSKVNTLKRQASWLSPAVHLLRPLYPGNRR